MNEDHRVQTRELMHRLRARRRLFGLCVQCGDRLTDEERKAGSRCEGCKRDNCAWQQAYRERQKTVTRVE
jgi:hypothetical protein